MGVMRFAIHPSSLTDDWPELHRAYVRGFDGRVHPTRVELQGNELACRRQTADSGKLFVTLPVPGFGRPMVGTCSLPEREQPYLLMVELARGKLARLRDQHAAWQQAGMSISDEFHHRLQVAQRLFSEAASQQGQPERASDTARKVLELAHQAADLLCENYIAQRLAVRRARTARLPASLGCGLGHGRPDPPWEAAFVEAFNAACVPLEWRCVEPHEGEYHWDRCDAQVEWCERHKLLTTVGPLLDLAPAGMPEWLWQWEHDFLNLQSFVCDFVETALSRYASRVRFWEVSARGNTGGALALSEENRLQLVARTLDVARQVDQDNHLLIRVDQPWGGYQARGQHRLSPMQFVDTLIRSGAALSGVNLEVAVGYTPRGTAPRDRFDFSQLIDQWSCLQIPLYVTLAYPSSGGEDPHARPDLEVERTPPDDADGPAWTDDRQAEFVERFVPMLMAKQSVAGIFWSHAGDAAPHDYPNAGLLRPDGSPKPALDRLIRYRHEFWGTE
jgi:hypothetical protein